MVDPKLFAPATKPVEVDSETLAAIDRGVEDAAAGRSVTLEEAHQLIPKWISKFESQKPR
jgi:predicted transcriptional regulator